MSMGMGRRRLPQQALARRWLLATTAIGLASCLALSQPVYADNECGAIVGNSVTCTSAGNNYTSGITYNTTDDLTMIVQDGVIVDATGGDVEGILAKVAFGSLDLTIGAATISTDGDDGIGILASVNYGDNSIVFGGRIETSGDRAYGILAGGENVSV